MSTLLLKIEYDGTNYSGWQRQPNAIGIQEKIETALRNITGFDCKIMGAGRTDSGVHARAQVASLPIDDSFTIPEDKIRIAINSQLPYDIRILKAQIFSESIDARRSAIARQYSYTLTSKYSVFTNKFCSFYSFKFDEDLLFSSAKLFLGEKDFSSLAKINPDIKNNVCIVEICRWEKIDEVTYKLNIKANHFLYGMVRTLVGTMLDVARGKKTSEGVLREFCDFDRKNISPLAPPNGLVLEKIFYPFDF